jgi:hypothetical protein
MIFEAGFRNLPKYPKRLVQGRCEKSIDISIVGFCFMLAAQRTMMSTNMNFHELAAISTMLGS